MTRKKSPKQEGDQAAEPQPTTRWCKFCEQDVDLGEWGYHLFYNHNLVEEMYDEFEPGQQRPKVIDTVSVKPIPPPPAPPPPPPEPKVTIRLAPIDGNPPTAGVEARRGCSYFFRKGEWMEIPAPDAWILLPGELHPGKYAELVFERQEPKDG